jgi:hypothetical protein
VVAAEFKGLSAASARAKAAAAGMRLRQPLGAIALIILSTWAARAAPYEPEPEFRVQAGGRDLDLHEFPQGAFAVFEVAAPQEVEIRTGFDLRWVNVRPRSAQVTPVIGADHRSVRFRLTSPAPLTVEFNDDLSRVVHLFAFAPERDAPAPGARGVRYFGPGLHEPGLIELRDGETLYLAPGAWVKGNVRSVGTRNVTIRGRGVLDGSDVGRRAEATVVGPGTAGRDNLIYLERTTAARVEGVTLFNSHGAWTFYLSASTGTRVDGVRILNPGAEYGDDGFDLVSSSDVRVENVFVRTNDDCVAVKNLADVDTHDITVRHGVMWNMPKGGNGLEVGFETRNRGIHDVHFQDIDIIHVERGSAISIHNGDAATVENVTFDDIRVEDARRKLIDFAVVYAQYGADKPPTAQENSRRLDRGGTWDGLLNYPAAEKAERSRLRGRIRNIRVTNLRVVEGGLPYSVLAGFDPEHEVEDVVFEGLQYQGRPILSAAEGRFSIEFARGVEFR